MSEQLLLDNDIVLKIACYSLVGELLSVLEADGVRPGMLGVGTFVVRRRLSRDQTLADSSRAQRGLETLVGSAQILEPDESEIQIAADLEAEASRQNLELDGGESQLLAILCKRGCAGLVTGDKRAILAMAVVALHIAGGRVVCLEQLMMRILANAGLDVVRSRVCAEPSADRATSLCFACSAEVASLSNVNAGLSSYIRALDQEATGILNHAFISTNIAV